MHVFLEHFPKFVYKKKHLYHPLGIESQLILTGCHGSSAKIVRQRLRRDIWKLGPVVFTRHSSCQYPGKRWSHVLNQHNFPDEIEKDLSFSTSVSYFVQHTHTHTHTGKSYRGQKLRSFGKLFMEGGSDIRVVFFAGCIAPMVKRPSFFFFLLLFFFLFFLLPVDRASKHPVSGSFCVLV